MALGSACVEGECQCYYGGLLLPEECPEGEEYNSCGSMCPATCSQPGPVMCPLMCVEGCFCPQGQVRDELSGQCIAPEQCPLGKFFNDQSSIVNS